jgi:processive 1,2-diacylglycerol beta-glucosyltransferase
MITLYDTETNDAIGQITPEQLEFLIAQLEEESIEDQDYYINQATVDWFEQRGADQALLDVLREGLGERDEMEIRWDRA